MTELTVKEFIDVVHRSQLISKDRLIDALSDCKQNGGLPEQALGVAEFLQKRGLLTAWQQQKLLRGRVKGFFLGDYRLLDHLGTGGMSTVFLAEHRLIGRRVAIKILPSSKVTEGTYLARFEQEARATSRLSHPHVVHVFDLDQHAGTHFMVMEYVAGRDLKALVRQQGPLPLVQVADYMAQAASGLEHIHQRGLIHRDIKPANIVVNHEHQVKILDLGLARRLEDGTTTSLTHHNDENMMGTADYQAPEQARDAHSVDRRADIYSLGCTLYYLLAGHAPFTEGTIAQRILMHQNQSPLDVRAIRPDCPHAIADVCMTMLAKHPDDRIQTAGTVAKRMRRWLVNQGPPNGSTAFPSADGTRAVPVQEQRLDETPVYEVATPVEDDAETSLAEQRKVRATKRVKVPLTVWIVLGLLSVICLVLIGVVISRYS